MKPFGVFDHLFEEHVGGNPRRAKRTKRKRKTRRKSTRLSKLKLKILNVKNIWKK
jgi:hypothetical protein